MMDMFYKFIYLKAGLFWLAFVFCLTANAQEKQKPVDQGLAKSIFHDKYRFGLTYGNSLLYTENEPNPLDYHYFNQFSSYEVGLTYNILYHKNWIWSTTLIYRRRRIKDFLRLKGEDIGTEYGFHYYSIEGPYFEWKLNTMLDYHFKIYKRFSGFAGVGPELTLTRKTLGSEISGFMTAENEFIGFTGEDDYNKTLFVGANVRFGVSINTKALLIQPFVMYHYQPQDMYTSTVVTQGLRVSSNTISKHSYTGNYLMFGVKLFPGKSLFSSKKK